VHLVLLLILGILPSVCNSALAETGRLSYELANGRIEVDDSSIERDGTLISWRERQVMREPVIDENSLRKVREVQWRKQADCQMKQVKVLSKTVFSVDDALVSYEGIHPDKAAATPFSKLAPAERRAVEALCGRTDSGSHPPEPSSNRPALAPAGQHLMPVFPR
jgi:hypothetical protein